MILFIIILCVKVLIGVNVAATNKDVPLSHNVSFSKFLTQLK